MKDFHKLYKHRWITPKARPQKSKVHGLGVVAIELIKKGEIVAVLGGVIVPISQIGEYQKKLGHIGVQIHDDFFICPTTRKEIEETGVFNHSCDPNIGYLDPITFVAIRNIKTGEELTFDYAFSETFFETFECNCNSINCRKIIKPDDWRILKIEKEYCKYFSPYLKRKFAKLKIQ